MSRPSRATIALLCAAPLLALAVGVVATSAFSPAVATAANRGVADAATPAATVAAPARRPVLLTGEVEASDSQTVFVPPSNSSPLVLRNFVAEGTRVKAGDLVLRIETGGAANIDKLKTELEQARARAEREAANLEVGAIDTEKALATAQAALAKAKVDAALPKIQISALNYDRNQAELDRATRDLVVKRDAQLNYRAAVGRRLEDGELEVKKLQINMAFQIAQLAQSEVRAARDGVVVHGYSPWKGDRFEEGSSAWPGNAAGVVQGNGKMAVTVWALEADRSYLSEGQGISLRFDALPGAALTGKIEAITSAPEARGRWGMGRYFRVKIGLPEGHGLPLAAGMSVFAEPLAATPAIARAAAPAAKPAQTPAAAPAPTQAATVAVTAAAISTATAAAAEDLMVEGDIVSRAEFPVSPPTIPYVNQYKLAQLAPEGMMIEAGKPIALFESNDVTTQLMSQQSALKEKQRALEKMRLDQAEADRAGDLAVVEAQSNAEKAERKATQPKELIRRVDYDKLVIERTEKAELARLTVIQRVAQSRARHAELAGLQAEIGQIQTQIAALVEGQKRLTVLAPRRGLVMYRTSFNGEKFNTGSQVWMGLSVATLADPEQLYVAAKVPEAQASSVHVGQRARVTVPGANQALTARVSGLGLVFHSKAGSQSIVVRDIELRFDGVPTGIKPGAAVQVQLIADNAAARKQEKTR